MSTTGCNNNNNNNNNSNNCILIIIFTGNSLQSIQSKLPRLSWHSGNSRGSTTGCVHVFNECLLDFFFFFCFSHLESYCVDSVQWVRWWEWFLETFQRSLWGVWWGQRSVPVTLVAQAEALLGLQVEPDTKGLPTHLGFNSSSLEFSKGPGLCSGWGAWLSYSRETKYLPCEQGAHGMTVNNVFEVV